MGLHYEVAGDGPPLLLLPGAALDGTSWLRAGFVEGLQDAFRCVMVDPPGMGRSARPSGSAGYGVGAIAEAVLGVADELGLERFAVWGVSAGGCAAMVLAAEHRERVERLVVSGAWPYDLEQYRSWFTERAAEWRELTGRELLRRAFAAEGLPVPAWAAELDPDTAVAAGILAGLPDFDWRGRAMPGDIAAPTLIMVGALEDADGEGEQAVREMPDATYVALPGLDHVAACLTAEATVPLARGFLYGRTAMR